MHIQILVYDGFFARDVLGPLDVLHAAAASGGEFRVEVVRIGTGIVTSAYGLQLQVPIRLDPHRPPELLLLPGGGWLAEAAANPWAAEQRDKIGAVVAAVHAAGCRVAAVGSGALLLAAAGLLRGRAAVSHHMALGELEAQGAEVVRARVVDEGDVLTSSGATAGLDLALWLVERHVGPLAAHAVERKLEYERHGTVWRRHD